MKNLLGVVVIFALLFTHLSVLASELQVKNSCHFNGHGVKSVLGVEPETVLNCWVSVRNRSCLFIRGVRVRIVIPNRIKYVSGTGNPALEKMDGRREIVWTVPRMAPEEERVFFYKLRILH